LSNTKKNFVKITTSSFQFLKVFQTKHFAIKQSISATIYLCN